METSFILVNDFLHHMKTMGKSESTITTYKSALLNFFKKTKSSPRSASSKTANEYLRQAVGTKKPATVGIMLTAIKMFFEFIGKPIEITIKAPTVIRKSYKIPSKDQVKEVVKAARLSDDGFIGIRNAAMVSVLYYTGMRPDEMNRMMMSDVYLQEKTIVIRTSKNKTGRSIPISSDLLVVLNEYIQKRSELNPDSGSFFITYGRNHRCEKISYGATRQIIKQAFKNAGLGEFPPYCLRHLFATVLIQSGTPINDVANLMGHKNAKSLLDYICSTELTRENCVDVL